MKKALTLIALLSIFVTGADGRDLVRLTVINKSGMDIALQLIGPDGESDCVFAVTVLVALDL